MKGSRKTDKLNVRYQYRENCTIEFSGPEPLGVNDLRVLQGLVALAGVNDKVLESNPKTEQGKQIRELLEFKWDAINQNAAVVDGSYYLLAREIGYANARDTLMIRKCVERLWKVSIIVQMGSRRMGFRLLSQYASDELNGDLHVVLNPLLAQAAIGGGRYVYIDLNEVRALRTDPARLLHQRLCAWINPGKFGRVDIRTLSAYVWADHNSGSVIRKRHERIRKALKELQTLSWDVEEYAYGKFEIGRPKLPTNLTNTLKK